MFPAFVPLFVFKIKSPVPLVVKVAFALLSPIWTVSAWSVTSPVPLGAISIFAFDVETISFPFTSKFPPNCGDVSPTTSEAESETSTEFDDVLKVAKVISSEPSKNLSTSKFEPEFVVSSQKVPVVSF